MVCNIQREREGKKAVQGFLRLVYLHLRTNSQGIDENVLNNLNQSAQLQSFVAACTGKVPTMESSTMGNLGLSTDDKGL